MQMHTRDSLRAVHGIDIGPTRPRRRINLLGGLKLGWIAASKPVRYAEMARLMVCKDLGKIVASVRREVKFGDERPHPLRIRKGDGDLIHGHSESSAQRDRDVAS